MDKEENNAAQALRDLVGFTPEAMKTMVEEQAGSLIQERIGKLTVNMSKVLAGLKKETNDKLEAAMKEMLGSYKEIRIEDGGEIRIIKGHMHPVTEEVLKVCRHPDIIPMLVGPAGCGKTHMVSHIGEAFGLRFTAQSMSEGITEGKLIGRETKDGYIMGIVEDYMKNGGVLLIDEIDAALDNVLIVLNSALANGYMINGRGEKIVQHKDCIFIASANTFGNGADRLYCGRNQLDGATLDRFVQFEMDYDTKFETQCATKEVCDYVWEIRKNAAKNKVRIIASTRMIKKGQALLDSGLKLTRVKELLTAGWSPDIRKQVGLK